MNTDAPGLVAVLRGSIRFAMIDTARSEIVLDIRAFVLALLAVGLDDPRTNRIGSTALWLADWLSRHADPEALRSGWREREATPDEDIGTAAGGGFRVVWSVSMISVFERAVALARRTVGRDRADLRHVVAALLGDPGRIAGTFRSAGLAISDPVIEGFRRNLHDRLARSHERDEIMTAWRDILLTVVPITLAGFAADRPADVDDGDPLGIGPDVQAFARLICLEEATPPLSIGVFGDWGAGKSTFMARLEAETDRIARQEAARRARDPATAEPTNAPRFVANVIQIRFNAWQFADANLWASITAEFFDQLRAGGYNRQGEQVHARLVERVNDHVHALSDATNASRQAFAESERVVAAAQSARDVAVDAAERESRSVVSQALLDAVTEAFEAHRDEIRALGRHAGRPDVARDVHAFVALARDARTVLGQARTVWRVALARRWPAVLLVAALTLVLGLLGMVPLDRLPALSAFLERAGAWSWLAPAASAAVALAPAWRLIRSVTAATARFADRLDEVSTGRQREVLVREAELRAAIAEADAKREAAGRADRALARYIDPAASSNPPRLLRFVLEDDPDTKAIDREIGLISRARRLFQAVDEIVKNERRNRRAGTPGDIAVPDRIVLYIDDLDRCTHEQVYAVLQAVHLLLAFELFVVVVAVDVRWVRDALARQMQGGGKTDFDPPAEDRDRPDRAASYLEKIFQIPFWLRPLTTEDSEEGSTYAGFVRQLLAADLAAREGDGSGRGGGPGADARPASTDTSRPAVPADATVRASEARQAGTAAPASIEEALSTVRLTPAEIEFLSGPAIGSLAARDPRGVKRLVNVYRLVRARLSAEELDGLLGTGDRAPAFGLLAIATAVETGQPAAVADKFYGHLQSLRTAEDFEAWATGWTPADPVGAALKALSGLLAQHKTRPAAQHLMLALQARRYSFNRYR